ncbi:MAG: hypothetical protein AAGJ08_29420 [Cyanobacteria bacterium P01_H01_bin.35]
MSHDLNVKQTRPSKIQVEVMDVPQVLMAKKITKELNFDSDGGSDGNFDADGGDRHH